MLRLSSTLKFSSKPENFGIHYSEPPQKTAKKTDSRGVVMNEELNYAEMLEIPVETVTVNRKKESIPKKRKQTKRSANNLSSRSTIA